MRTIFTWSVTTAVALVLAVSASLAGGSTRSPLSLVLKKSDFPAGMQYKAEPEDLSGFNPYLEAASVSYEPASYDAISHSKAKGLLHVAGMVFTTPSVAQARKGYSTILAKRYLPFWIGASTPLALPSYGDQQVARIDPAGSEGQWTLNMVVRKRATLWLLHLVSERRPAISKTEVLATFNSLARKQRARVGNG
jgi:hypothetical protein